jgi:hypothetical protein
MAEMQYNFGPLWQARDENGTRVTLSVWGGRTSLAVFKQGASKPDIKEPIPVCLQIAMRDTLKQLLNAEPGAKFPLIKNSFDRNAKQWIRGLVMNFIKTEKKTAVIEISTPQSEAFKFPLRASCQYTTGDPVSEEVTSMRGVQELITLIDRKLPLQETLSTFNLSPLNRGGQNGGRGGYNNQNRPHQTSDGYRKQQTSSDPFGQSVADDAEIF